MKVYVESYGCTQNAGEARLMEETILARGHGIARRTDDADANVLVTCTVVGTTERAMLRRMRTLAAGGKPLVVAGCMAGAQRDLVRRTVPDAKILPPRRWPDLVDLLGAGTVCADRALATEVDHAAWRDAIVPIAQGCAGRCTYCITRFARGRVSSYALEDLVDRVGRYVAAGIREIKLTGQDTAAYGVDGGPLLPDLLRAITSIDGEFRIRVGMADPLTVLPILDDLIGAYASGKVFKFLHLPVQSGDDGVLAAMRREYEVADFEEIVERFRRAFPDLTLSTDIIVGFPGETDPAFDRTLDLVARVAPDIVNVTRFSPRPGTQAASYPKPVVGSRVKERSRRLTDLRRQIARAINATYAGRTLSVLTTEPGRDRTTLARTDAYKQVVLDTDLPIGEFHTARILVGREADLLGELISSAET